MPGRVDVPDVLILLPGRQLEKIFASQSFFLWIQSLVAKLALAAVISSKVLIAFARFVVKSMRSVMAPFGIGEHFLFFRFVKNDSRELTFSLG